MKRLLRWLRRDKALEAFLARSAMWQRQAAEWDHWQKLERIDPLLLNFREHLDLEMYRMQADLRRDLRRQVFGSGAMGQLEGLNALLNAEYAPGIWRAMNEPNPILSALKDGTL